MSHHVVCDNIIYDHEQGVFMIYVDEKFKLIPKHYISWIIEDVTETVKIVCNTKHLQEEIVVQVPSAKDVVAELRFLLESIL